MIRPMRKGQKATPEQIEKNIKGHIGIKLTEEQRNKISAALKGRVYSTPKRRLDGKGYIFLYRPNHQMANNTGYIFEHRLVMAEYLGRMLDRSEIVHHKDGNRQNNIIENLEITNRKDHLKIHFDPQAHSEKIKKIRKEKFWSSGKRTD